ncbi:MAG TPA: response regulator [Chloroflexota bacterium]|nr:response regulator [Chloroflexota bacterium]
MAKVLVADDEPGIRNLICEILREEGYDVVPARDGLKAVERAKEDKPDLAVLDMMMPGLSGSEVVRRMDEEGLPKLPVIYISAVPYSGQVDGSRPAIFLAKPFDIGRFLSAVSSLLG